MKLNGEKGSFFSWAQMAYELNDDGEETFSVAAKRICDAFEKVLHDNGISIAQQLYDARTIVLASEIQNAAKYLDAGGQMKDLPDLASVGFLMSKLDKREIDWAVTYMRAGKNAEDIFNFLQNEATRSISLYRQSGEYAREHGELDAFRASRQANVACKEAIEAAIRAGFDGMHLTADAKGVLAEFGPERVTYVLAATIQSKDWDERFSRSNKAWAAAVPMFEREDRRCSYIVNIHSTVVDGFVSMVRKELDAMRDQPGQTAKKPSIRDQLAAAKAVQAEKPAAQQRQKGKESR